VGLKQYVDPRDDFTLAYPAGWMLQTEAQTRDRLGTVEASAAEETLSNVAIELVSPDERALFALIRVPLDVSESNDLDAVVQRILAANAAGLSGIEDSTLERTTLDGVDAVRLTFTVIDSTDASTGVVAGRVIQQLVVVRNTDVIILTSITGVNDAETYSASLRQIEQSWHWTE